MTVLLIGKSGYVASALIQEMESRKLDYFAVSRKDVLYTDEETLRETIGVHEPTHLVNCAAFVPQPSVDACKDNRPETWRSNVHLPEMLARVCNEMGVML